jgi:hypothetical protein
MRHDTNPSRRPRNHLGAGRDCDVALLGQAICSSYPWSAIWSLGIQNLTRYQGTEISN